MRTLRASRTSDALDAARTAPGILDALASLDAAGEAVRADGDAATEALRSALEDETDQVTAVVAAHAAGHHPGPARALLLPLLDPGAPELLRRHAAWALAAGPRLPDAVEGLYDLAAEGGMTGLLAAETLRGWDRAQEERSPRPRPREALRVPGLTVAQLFLHADIDGTLRHSGRGDTGGIATLLVHLGDALLEQHGVGRVLTLSRSHDEDRAPADAGAPGHHYLGVALPGPVRRAADTWTLLEDVRAGLRQALRDAGPVDVLHLRMADVGSWAAADVARELGIPTVLTLAPDPHALLAAREADGSLTRATFGDADLAEHLVLRVRLLADLARRAAHLVALPRPHLEHDLRELLHVDEGTRADRLTVVPEGIDLAPLDRAAADVAAAGAGAPVDAAAAEALADLDAVLAALPASRRDLPLVITVGRLHPVKGMSTLAAAWAGRPGLQERANLLVVGGDLRHPSADEAGQLAGLHRAVAGQDPAGSGLLLAGHRPNATVATWLAAARAGRAGLCAPDGVYVSASLKEEFGIAILEALASGLVVVAPRTGGPATYVEHGRTGLLVDTSSATDLAAAVDEALDLAAAPDREQRAARARATVADRFGIATMAAALSDVYAKVHRDAARPQP